MRHTQGMSRRPELKTLPIKRRLARSRRSRVAAVEVPVTFAEAAKKYIGSIDYGPGDLATNPKHLKDFGR